MAVTFIKLHNGHNLKSYLGRYSYRAGPAMRCVLKWKFFILINVFQSACYMHVSSSMVAIGGKVLKEMNKATRDKRAVLPL